ASVQLPFHTSFAASMAEYGGLRDSRPAGSHLMSVFENPLSVFKTLMVGRAILPAAAFQAARSCDARVFAPGGRRLIAGRSQDWLPHGTILSHRGAAHPQRRMIDWPPEVFVAAEKQTRREWLSASAAA